MAVVTTSADILNLLPARTHCGLAFDLLSSVQRSQTCLIGGKSRSFFWTPYHHVPALVPWTVLWSNGTHQIAMSLKPSASAWAAARCFFDRLPPAVARAAIATSFKPLVAMFAGGPWFELAEMPGRLMPGGAHAIATGAEDSSAVECEFSFSDAAAANCVCAALRHYSPCTSQPDFFIACELHLGRLHIARSQLQALRVGDVLMAGCRNASVGSGSSSINKVNPAGRTLLRDAFSKKAFATVMQMQAGWQVVSLNTAFSTELSMQDDEFTFDEDASTADDSENEGETGADGVETVQGLDLADLKVGVDLVACHLSMTVAEIQALRPGSVLELTNSNADSFIEIKVGGRRFATGILIALDGRLAVQVTDLVRKPLPLQS